MLAPLLALAAAAHPHLLFGAGEVPALQAKAQGAGQGFAAPFQQGVDGLLGQPPPGPYDYGDPREGADMLVPVAMAAVLQPDAAHLDLAGSYLDAYLGWSDWQYGQGIDLATAHFVYDVALAYDWLYPSLSSSQRAAVISRLSNECDALQQASQGAEWWATEFTQNHNWINNAALGVCALALEGDAPAAQTDAWLGASLADLTQVVQVLDQTADGSWHEGVGYQSYGMSRLLPFLEMLRRVKGQDLTDFANLRAAPRYRAANMLPGRPREYLIENGDTWGWDGEESLFLHTYAAARFGDAVAQGVAQTWMAAAPLNTYVPDIAPEVFAFLAYDPAVPAADLADMPRDHRFTDLQAAIFRSDATAQALALGLKAGPYGGKATFARLSGAAGPLGLVNVGHDHADDNGLYLFANGQPLLPEAAGYNAGVGNGHPPAQLTAYHNSLLVDGLGQLGENRTQDDLNGLAWATARTAGLARGGSMQDYAFAVGAGAALYPAALNLTRFDRQVLLVDRRFAVVRDALDSSDPHTFTQVWHFLDGASQATGWVKGVAKGGQLLGVGVVSPAGFAFSTAPLSPDSVDHLDPDGVVTQANVSTPAAVSSARMLSVLWPSSTGAWAARPTLAPLSATEGAGAVITDGTTVYEVLLHDTPAELSTEGDLTVDGLGAAVTLSGGQLQHVALLEGVRLQRGGATLLELPAPATVEVAFSGGALALTGEGVTRFKAFAPGASSVSVNGRAVAFQLDGETVVVPPYGQAPTASSLADAEHPVWHAEDGPTNPVWSGTGGWPTAGSTSGGATASGTSGSTGSASTSATSSTSSTSSSGSTGTAGTTGGISASSSSGSTGSTGTSTGGTTGWRTASAQLSRPASRPQVNRIRVRIDTTHASAPSPSAAPAAAAAEPAKLGRLRGKTLSCTSGAGAELAPLLLALGALLRRRR